MTTDDHEERATARAQAPQAPQAQTTAPRSRSGASAEERARERARGGAHPPPRGSAEEEFYYRRSLGTGDFLTAAGVAVGVGVAAFYVASLFLQRTPLEVPREPVRRRRRKRPA